MGLIMGSNSAIAAVSPLIAALIVDGYGLGSVFYYSAALIAAATTALFFTPLRRAIPAPAHTKVAAG
jgi:hypothetical protein